MLLNPYSKTRRPCMKINSCINERLERADWLIMKREFADWLITQKGMVERCKEVGIQSPDRLFSKKKKKKKGSDLDKEDLLSMRTASGAELARVKPETSNLIDLYRDGG